VKRLGLLILAGVGSALAAGFLVQGNLSEAWDKSSLEIRASAGVTKLWFGLPARSGMTVVAKPDSGATVTVKMNLSGTIDLRAPGVYAIEMTRDSGEGQWTCKDVTGNPVLLGFGSTVDEQRHARMSYRADDDKETWRFKWPKDVTFLVRLLNASGKVMEEQDLWDSDRIELVGGGSFTLEVAPTDGSGEFSASKSE